MLKSLKKCKPFVNPILLRPYRPQDPTDESINGAPATTVSQLTYNETGQLLNKQLGNGLQIVNYAYNERGWLKSSNAPLFAMQLNYNDGSIPQYNGKYCQPILGQAGQPEQELLISMMR